MTTDLDWREEAGMDQAFDAQQDLIAEDQEQAERLGFAEGDKVTVGKSKKEWIIHSFFPGYDPGVPLARLEPVLGFSATSVTVDRLRAVTP